MGLKGYRLWVMGQLDSTCRAPPLYTTRPGRRVARTPGCQIGYMEGVGLAHSRLSSSDVFTHNNNVSEEWCPALPGCDVMSVRWSNICATSTRG
jgi:hypothetical protein